MSAALDAALRLLSAGRRGEAVAAVKSAANAGDAEACMQLAVWCLSGSELPRDLAAARALLRRAVVIGHVDAALMEIALIANGSGMPPDFAAARTLLGIAAKRDPIAAAQFALLGAMALRAHGEPVAVPVGRLVSTSPAVRHFPALLTPDECAHLARTAEPLFEPALVLDPRTGRQIPHPVRTSDGAVIGPAREDLVVRAINLRIAAASGTDVAAGEALTVLRYAPGQQYRPHHDAIAGAANQRAATMLVYLNDGYGGGETVFPDAALSLRGRRGDGILFANLLPDGRADPAARHAGLPVTAGYKWLATRWIRQAPLDPWSG